MDFLERIFSISPDNGSGLIEVSATFYIRSRSCVTTIDVSPSCCFKRSTASAGNGDRLLAAHGKIGRIGVLAFQYIHTHICHRRVRKC